MHQLRRDFDKNSGYTGSDSLVESGLMRDIKEMSDQEYRQEMIR